MRSIPKLSFGFYEAFAFFLPGLTAIFALMLILPNKSLHGPLSTPAIITLGILTSLIVGLGIHAVAAYLESVFGRNHRAVFKAKVTRRHADRWHVERFDDALHWTPLARAEYLDHHAIDRFWLACRRLLGEDVRSDVEDRNAWAGLYRTVRSYVAIDGRGRSHKFQAIYAFCRSMWFTQATIALVYLEAFPDPYPNSDSTSILSGILEKGPISHVELVAILAFSAVVFYFESRTFKRHYVDYMIADFVNMVEGRPWTEFAPWDASERVATSRLGSGTEESASAAADGSLGDSGSTTR